MLHNLSDQSLMEAYHQAIDLKLSPEFISVLKLEISRRFVEEGINNKEQNFART
ncbi:sporulation histidine kinase inhibitor Sda [Pseudalkalibacillus sp. A8]|uniref:sporulation histidine kinase inhibitor Sda n=1 Tax=Pseudalkalibacillus sp. A8 TaxID=3382641 RepID=UPI0038B5434B